MLTERVRERVLLPITPRVTPSYHRGSAGREARIRDRSVAREVFFFLFLQRGLSSLQPREEGFRESVVKGWHEKKTPASRSLVQCLLTVELEDLP